MKNPVVHLPSIILEGCPVEEDDTKLNIFEIRVTNINWSILFHFKKCLEIGTTYFSEGLALSWTDEGEYT